MTLSTARTDAETQEASEVTFEEFKAVHASIRVFGRVRGAPGAVAGIFTYLNDTQESDIEILTRDTTNYVQYTNQPSSSGPPDWTPIRGSTVNVTMPDSRRYTDWNVHRLDWTPGRSVFFVDDIQTNTTALHVPVATPPSEIYINMWSANSTWSGNMDIGESAEFDIQWIELLFNITDAPTSLSSGDNVCAVGFFDQEAEQQSRGLRFGSRALSALVYGFTLVVWLSWLS